MNHRISCFAWIAAIAFLPALSAKAVNPHLVVMAVNSGGDVVAPYDFDPPTMTPGAKGFLIGMDTGNGPALASSSVHEITFSGPGLVHKEGIGIVDDGGHPTLARYPRIMTRHEADLQSVIDSMNYAREDTHMIDKQSSSMGFTPVLEQFLGGLASDHFFKVWGSPNIIGNTPSGIYPLAYVVTSSDVDLTGLIERGARGFDVLGEPVFPNQRPGTAVLDFTTETIRVPEPSSVVMAVLGVVCVLLYAHGATFHRWKHSRTSCGGFVADSDFR